MPITDRDKLLRRIRQIRRTNALGDPSPGDAPEPESDRVRALEGRISHLEKQLEGFQDSVHREMARHDDLITELQGQVDPRAMGAALAEHARNRGL